MSDIPVYSFLVNIAAELYAVPWGWIGLGALIMFLGMVVMAVMPEIRSLLKGSYYNWEEILGIRPRSDRVTLNIWRWLKAQFGQTTAVPEEEKHYTVCGTVLVAIAKSKELKALSGDIQACLQGSADIKPPEDPDPWGMMRTRLKVLAAALDSLGVRHPPLPRADTVMLEETGRWRDYLKQLLPIAERGDCGEAESTFGMTPPDDSTSVASVPRRS